MAKKTAKKKTNGPKPPTGWQDGCELVEYVPAVDYLFNHPKIKTFAEMEVPAFGTKPDNEFMTPLGRTLTSYTRQYDKKLERTVWIRADGIALYLSGANHHPEYRTTKGFYGSSLDSKKFKFWHETLRPQTEKALESGRVVEDTRVIDALDAINDILLKLRGLSFWYLRCSIQSKPISDAPRVIPSFTTLGHIGIHPSMMRLWVYCSLGFEVPAYLEVHSPNRKEDNQATENEMQCMRVFFPWDELEEVYAGLGALKPRRKPDQQIITSFKKIIREVQRDPDVAAKDIHGTKWADSGTIANRLSDVRRAMKVVRRIIDEDPGAELDLLEGELRRPDYSIPIGLIACVHELRQIALSQNLKQ